MSQPYYYHEHLAGYAEMELRGLKTWGEVHGDADGFLQFSSREFLEYILPKLDRAPGARALELGCGTGPGACLLAERGWCVDGIDLVPTAIEKARELAAERGLSIGYEVMDITQLPHSGPLYDLIVDSYCTQGIVAAEDRADMFGAIKARLAPGGYYVSSCCVYEAERIRADEEIVDCATGKRYLRFDESGLWDDTAEICYSLFKVDRYRPDIEARHYEGAIEVNGQWYIMQRCYRRPEHLRRELAGFGLEMVHQSGVVMENSVCVHAGTGSAVAFA